MESLGVSERRACSVIGISRCAFRYLPPPDPNDDRIRKRVIELSTIYGRYGYRKITSLLNNEGTIVGKDKVFTIWQQEGLKVPQKQPKRGRIWRGGSCIRLRPEYKHHVWSYDFVSHETHTGRKFKILNVIDEYSRECLTAHVAPRIRSDEVIHILADLFLKHGIPKHIRSDNGPEFIAKKLLKWFNTLGVAPLFIEPGSPWENGYCESFNGKMRYELLNGEIFFNLLEAKVIIKNWVEHYNKIRPHSALGGRPPAPESVQLNLEMVC